MKIKFIETTEIDFPNTFPKDTPEHNKQFYYYTPGNKTFLVNKLDNEGEYYKSKLIPPLKNVKTYYWGYVEDLDTKFKIDRKTSKGRKEVD